MIPIQIAIVGCGAVTEIYYTPALTELARSGLLEMCTLVDPSEERLGVIGGFFPSADRVKTISQIRRQVDLAIVASPVKLHSQQAIELLKAGMHVLCEKPMGVNARECEAMIQAARSSGRLLAVGLFRRFFPATQAMADLIAREVVGRAMSFTIVEGYKFQWRAKTDSFFRKETAGGGVLIDLGVHVLDLMLWWFGEPESIDYEDDGMGGVEANCKLTVRYARGLEGVVRLSRDWTLENRYHVNLQNGWASWNPGNASQLQLGISPGFPLRGVVHESVNKLGEPDLGDEGLSFQQSFMRQIENVCRSILGQEKIVVPGEEGIKSVGLIESCYQSKRWMQLPWMTDKELQAARGNRC
jgi:predicted dehydrogenase